MRTIIAYAFAALAILGALGFTLNYLAQSGAVEMSIHGWIASGLGVVFTLALGFGLMRLSYVSARRGHDEAVGGDRPPRP